MYYTNKQLEIMEFLQQFRSHRQLSPTLDEMAENFGVSRVTIHEHVKELVKKGAISSVPYKARSIEILDPQYQESTASIETGAAGGEQLPVEILGRIAAGEPIEAAEVPERVDRETFEIVTKRKNVYRVRINFTGSKIRRGV